MLSLTERYSKTSRLRIPGDCAKTEETELVRLFANYTFFIYAMLGDFVYWVTLVPCSLYVIYTNTYEFQYDKSIILVYIEHVPFFDEFNPSPEFAMRSQAVH